MMWILQLGERFSFCSGLLMHWLLSESIKIPVVLVHTASGYKSGFDMMIL